MSEDEFTTIPSASPEAEEFLTEVPPLLAHSPIWLALLFLVTALIWSILSKVDVVVQSVGVIRPAGEVRPIISPWPARVLRFEVQNGQKIQQGDTLCWLLSKTASQDIATAREAEESLKRTRSKIAKDLPSRLSKIHSNYQGAKQKLVTLKELKQRASQEAALIDQKWRFKLNAEQMQLESTQEQVNQAQLNLRQAESALKYRQKTLETHRKLATKGLVSKLRILELEQAAEEASAQVKAARSALRQARKLLEEKRRQHKASQSTWKMEKQNAQSRINELDLQIAETQAKLNSLKNELTIIRTQASTELAKAESRYRSVKISTYPTRSSLRKDDIKEYPLTAPISGIITGLDESKSGTPVTAGATLMTIVPSDVPLVIKSRVANRDMAELKEGLPVKFEFDAFPREQYGILKGKLIRISADATKTDNGQLTYEVVCSLDETEIKGKGRTHRIFPGLTCRVEIVTHQERIIDLILQPFKKLSQQIDPGR